jgi:hypothetical protein
MKVRNRERRRIWRNTSRDSGFVELGQEKVLPHLPIPPRSFALAIGPVVLA